MLNVRGCCLVLAIIFSLKYTTCDLIKDVFDAIKDDNIAAFRKILSENTGSLDSFINLKDKESGQTPVMMSVLRGQTEMVRLLLAEPVVDVSIGEMQGYTVMHGAGFQGRADILRLLLEDKRNIDPRDFHEDGFSPLHRACWGDEPRHTETVRVFLEVAGIPWDLRSEEGTTCYDVTYNQGTRDLIEKWKKQKEEL